MAKRISTLICFILAITLLLTLSACKEDTPDIEVPTDGEGEVAEPDPTPPDDPDKGEEDDNAPPSDGEHEHDYEIVVLKKSSCTERGEIKYLCSCGHSYNQITAASGHTRVVDEAVEPTCTEPGLTEGRHCSVCNEILSPQQVIPAFGHNEVYDPPKEPTCITPGKTEGSHCSECGVTINAPEVIEALGHNEVIDAELPASCERTGLTEGRHCSVCGTVTIEQTEIPMSAHTYDDVFDKSCNACGYIRDVSCSHESTILIKGREPSCTVAGLTDGYRCRDCDQLLVAQEVIEATGHKWIEADCDTRRTCSVCLATEGLVLGHELVIDPAVAPTCSEKGLTEGKHCTRCDYVVEQKSIPSLGHNFIVDPAVAPGCTESGLTEGKHCLRCDFSIPQKIVAALGHDYTIDPAVEPTCTESGLTEGRRCDLCGERVEQTVIEPLGHQLVIQEEISPTCTESGLSYGEYCERCDYSIAQAALPPLGHTEVIDEAKAPTCTEEGRTEGKRCSVCGIVLSPSRVISPTGHTEVIDEAKAPTCTEEGRTEGKHCSVCGEILAYAEIISPSHSWIGADCTSSRKCSECGITDGAPLGHTETVDKGISPTCTTDGYSDGKYCTVCGTVTLEKTLIPALGHTGYEEDFLCDVCGELIPPEEGASLSLDRAEQLCLLLERGEYTEHSYLISGVILSVEDKVYGNMTLTDSLGNVFAVSGLYQDGIRYDSLVNKPTTGDTVFIYGRLGNMDGGEMKDASLISYNPHTHSYSSPTCLAPATCTVCGATKGDRAEHSFVDGKCTVCGRVEESVGETELNYKFSDYDSGVKYAEDEEHILDDNTTVITDQCHFTTQIRIYSDSTRNGSVIISSASPVSALRINAGYGRDTLIVYGSDGGESWVELGRLEITAVFKDHSLSFTASYKMLKLDVLGQNEIRLTNMTLTSSVCTEDEPEDNEDGSDTPAESEYIKLARFEFGEKGSPIHYEGVSANMGGYTETADGYTISITDFSNMYLYARDSLGNSCIKLGTSGSVGSISFTVGADVDRVVLRVAKYKEQLTRIEVNGATHVIDSSSNSGEYTEITVDTSSVKTVELSTLLGGCRCMIDSIELYAAED